MVADEIIINSIPNGSNRRYAHNGLWSDLPSRSVISLSHIQSDETDALLVPHVWEGGDRLEMAKLKPSHATYFTEGRLTELS